MSDTITRYPRTLFAQRRNRVSNPRSFNDVVGYTDVSSPGVAAVLSRGTGVSSPVGGQCARVSLSAVSSGWWGVQYAPVAASGGITAIFSAYVRTSAAHLVTLVIQYRDGTDAVLLQKSMTNASLPATTWTRYSVSETAPSGTTYATLQVRVQDGGAVGHNLEVAGLMFELGTTLGTYFDGAKPDAPPLYWRWIGADHASPSTENILNPADVITPTIIDGYEGSYETRTIVHNVIGAATTNVTFVPVGPKSGVMQLVFATKADAAAAATALKVGAMFTLDTDQDAPIDMTFVVAGGSLTIRLDPETRSVWLLEVPFAEVT